MSPRMRPSSTRKSMPSSAMVVPKTLRRPRASMQAMALALLLLGWLALQARASRAVASCGGLVPRLRGLHQFFRCDAEPLNSCGNSGPMLRQKFLAFSFEKKIARAGFDEHPKTALLLDQLLVDQFLKGLQNGKRVDPIFGRDIAHRRQRVAFVEHAVENHGN